MIMRKPTSTKMMRRLIAAVGGTRNSGAGCRPTQARTGGCIHADAGRHLRQHPREPQQQRQQQQQHSHHQLVHSRAYSCSNAASTSTITSDPTDPLAGLAFHNPMHASATFHHRRGRHRQHAQCTSTSISARSYFTNGDRIKKDDPYATLGLSWGDGATTADIKAAFRAKARELHPDLNTTDTPQQAQAKFQQLRKAYETLLQGTDGTLANEEWYYATWLQADRIANDRTDVAGVRRKRPIQPVTATEKWGVGQLGHPSGRGIAQRGEYIGTRKRRSTVGRGTSKWVAKPDFVEWKG